MSTNDPKGRSLQRLISLSLDDLKAVAAARCLDIFDDYKEGELGKLTPATREAWYVGQAIREKTNNEAERRAQGGAE